MVPWCHGATVPLCHGATAPRCVGTMALCCLGAMDPRCYGATVPWCLTVTAPWRHGALLPRCLAAAVPRCHGAWVPWCHGATVPWSHGAKLSWCPCATVPWCHGATVPVCHSAIVPWCRATLVPWRLGALAPWYHGAIVPRCLCATISWCHDAMVPWRRAALVPWRQGDLVTTVRWCCGAFTVLWYLVAMAPQCVGALVTRCQASLEPRCMDIQLYKESTMAGHYTSAGVRHWRHLQHCTRRSQKPLIAICLHARMLFSLLCCALMPHSKSQKTSSCDAVVFCERPLDIVCLTVWNGTHAKLEKQVANSGKGKTNLSHDGLNPAHFPYWWVNNPILGKFCFTMIGKANIEGSKSNVVMNAWLPQASYPCGNFSDTSSFEFRRSKGSLGHAFTVHIRTGNQNQTSFYPSIPHDISVLVELILRHLRYLLTDVPP
ncbi:hypothetical protein CQW23_31692 [Capsicum baccatum]|uniref:Regulator of rDNA transcription protein 15 n=1 Tax=Capsicum baccatum TaxID=33114 RepID=A0A2G2V6V1_CAPBA|nr:hypothetical protein CQW23_31692 [Capsicum baccatum]